MRLFVSALEPSSNLHLRSVLKFLDQKNLQLKGIFDPSLSEQANNASAPLFLPTQFSVMGISGVIKKLPFLFGAIKLCAKEADGCDVVLLMDASSFNLRLSKKLARHNRVIYYILPQTWAWKPWRIEAVVKSADVLCAILPFELESYRRYFGSDSKTRVFESASDYFKNDDRQNGDKNASVVYVGHPLLDEISQSDLRSDNLEKNPGVLERLIFMPGSRPGEIERIFPIYRELAKKLQGYRKILVVPLMLRDRLSIYGDVSEFEISFDAKDALKSAKFAFICSGTATLEAALLGVPFVLAYVASKLDYALLKRFIKLNYIGLANLMHERIDSKKMHDELIQDACTPDALLSAFLEFDYENYRFSVASLRAYLKNGSAQNVAKIIESSLNHKRGAIVEKQL